MAGLTLIVDMQVGIAQLVDLLEKSEKGLDVSGFSGSSPALLLSRIVQKHKEKSVLVIVSTDEDAEKFLEDCKTFFRPEDALKLRPMPSGGVHPYQHLSPDPREWADRIEVLSELAGGRTLAVVASAEAAMRRVPKKQFIIEGSKEICLKGPIDPFELTQFLLSYGYEETGLVEDEGSFARRGGIMDVWTPSSDSPVRIELDGERIASMRYFDPATQRSKGNVNGIVIIPVSDLPLDPESRKRAARRIRSRAEEMDVPAREWRAIIEAVKEGIAFPGRESFMPFFHDGVAAIFDYIPKDSLVFIDNAAETTATAENHFKTISTLWSGIKNAEHITKPDELILPPPEFESRIGEFQTLKINALPARGENAAHVNTHGNADVRAAISAHKKDEDALNPLAEKIAGLKSEGFRIVFTCHTAIQAERLSDLFRRHGMGLKNFDAPFDSVFSMTPATLNLRLGRLSAGFRWPAERIAVITDEEIFGAKIAKRVAVSRPMEPFTSFSEIAEGDFIVHEKHGIGRYIGLIHMTIEDVPGDYLLLEYLGGDKLYLPVYRLNLVGRYIGSGDSSPSLDKLGGFRWAAIRQKVDASVRTMAKELLDIYAAREVYPGFPFPDGATQYEEFSAAFPYDETPDQARAIDEVMRDMGIEKPMDRLICGDVGYGKTEVAMRAAFRSALAGKQAAVLVPTTVLALQHYDSFTKRFKDTPVTIEMLSRFRTAKGQKEIIGKISGGTLDIVIGTHRLLQKDVKFRDLGLLIVDEEHRFGVAHKERIKKMKSAVDVVTLTATPIPRTLNFSLSGIRDISIINTPPLDRHAIATYVVPFDEGVIRGAIIKELARRGQIFFVHNRVETISSMHDRLKRLVPEARIIVGHGQLKESELERVMIDFLEGRADVLLCTTIIESGLDIPNANTIIIHRADTFGLAQLYQMRGRVGRSSAHAYAYLLTPEGGGISPVAKKRLAVLTRFTELGSGFQIAMHDLESRGAGNILGGAQSGHIAMVGYEMYAKLLERAVRKLKGKEVADEIDPELALMVPAFLPENYVPDPGTRIDLYRRLANRETAEEIAVIGEELADRFGALPKEAQNLLAIMEIKVIARRLRILKIAFDGRTLSCRIDKSSPITPRNILMLSAQGFELRLAPPDKLVVALAHAGGDMARLSATKNTLSALAGCGSEG